MSDQHPVSTQPVSIDHNTAYNPVINVPKEASNYTTQEVKFNFRKDNELGTKRPTVSLQLRFLTLEGLINILEGGNEKEIALVLDTLQTPILEQARAQVDSNETITQETLNHDALSWKAIAQLEPATRRGNGIPKEVWEAFVKDYIEVMPAVTGKTVEQVSRAAALLAAKLNSIKTNKPILKFIRSQLDLYLTSTSKAEEFAGCYEALVNKAEAFLAANDEDLLANL